MDTSLIPTTTYLVVYDTPRGRWTRAYTRLGDAKRFIKALQLPKEGRKRKPWPPVSPDDIWLLKIPKGTASLPHDFSEETPRARAKRGTGNVPPESVVAMVAHDFGRGAYIPNAKELKAEFFPNWTINDIQAGLTLLRTRDDLVVPADPNNPRSRLIRR